MPILKLIFHSHIALRIFRLYKSLKGTYTFGHKVILTYLTASKSEKKLIPGRSSHERNMVVNTVLQSESCVKYRLNLRH